MTESKTNVSKDHRKVKSVDDSKSECKDCPRESSQEEVNAEYIQNA